MLSVPQAGVEAGGEEEEEEAGESSRENLDQWCEQAREQLTNSIRLQWRRLKNHMEKLDSQGTTDRPHGLIPGPRYHGGLREARAEYPPGLFQS